MKLENWKQKLRSNLFDWLPPSIYLKVVPTYFKIFNSKRRGCGYKFSRDDNGSNVLDTGKSVFYFADHRRINRYVYIDGLDKIKKMLLQKYCFNQCQIQPTDIVVEVGANVGEFTLAVAEKAKMVYAFEPDPKCFECLHKNVQALKNVQVFKYGVSDSNGEKFFYLSTKDADSSFIKPKTYTAELRIDAIRLDAWMDSLGLKNIDFLKVEAEGAEMEVLHGLGDKINAVHKISVDGSPERNGKTTFNEAAAYLSQHNFHVEIVKYQVYAWK